MPLQPPQFIGDLDSTNPRGTDPRTIADDSIRNFKEGMRMSFPNVTGEASPTHADLNLLTGLAAASAKLMTGSGGVTQAVFLNPTAPPGWTIVPTTFDARMLVVAGTLNGTLITGGDTGGTNDPAINNTVASHTHPVSPDPHQHFTVREQTVSSRGNPSPTTVGAHFLNTNQNDETFIAVAPGGDADVHLSSPTSLSVDADPAAADWVPAFAAGIVCQLDV